MGVLREQFLEQRHGGGRLAAFDENSRPNQQQARLVCVDLRRLIQ
ncbi:MAG TPA: hypothetical protein VGH74_18840 [Planctomycetaceae bacterium]